MNDCECNESPHPSYKEELPHLNRIGGQIDGVKKMIDGGRYCPDILAQLRAIRSAIKNIELRILDTHLSCCVTQACLSHNEKEQRKKIEEIKELIKRFE